jgi:nucleotide-binding universal stress UspA family protein
VVQKILVAIDQSDISKAVFSQALSLAQATGASLHLLHILSTEEEGSPVTLPMQYPAVNHQILEEYRGKWQRFESERLEQLEALSQKAIAAGVKAEISQVSGSPGRLIVELSQNWGADLIVVGRRGRSGLKELVLGSVSNYVVHRARSSVLVVQH